MVLLLKIFSIQMATKKHPTYWALLPNAKDQLIGTATQSLSAVQTDPHAVTNLKHIEECLGLPDHSKVIAHHVTLFFTKGKNQDIVKEGDVLDVSFHKLGWSPTNVVFFGDVKKDGESINHLLENTDRTHLTFSCDKTSGGKAVDSGKVVPHIELAEPIVIQGIVHELYAENSNKVQGGEPPVVPEKKAQSQSPPKTKGPSPQQLFKNLLKEPPTPEMMKEFSLHFRAQTPSEDEIQEYINKLV
jgi:hypothetical protein